VPKGNVRREEHMPRTGTTTMVSPLMTPQEAAELLGVAVDELEAMRVAGDVAQPIRVGSATLYWRTSIDELIPAG